MKKYKQFIVGFILGAIIFIVLPVSAEIKEYILYKSDCSIVINGTDWRDSDLPMLNYKGFNYIPAAAFKAISEQIGASFNFDNSTKVINITTQPIESPQGIETEIRNTPSKPTKALPENMEYVLVNGNKANYWAISYNGSTYINRFYASIEYDIEIQSDITNIEQVKKSIVEGNSIAPEYEYYFTKNNVKYIIDISDTNQCIFFNNYVHVNTNWLSQIL